jgi:hypothetical protein
MKGKHITLPVTAALAVVFVALPLEANAQGKNEAPGQQPPAMTSIGPSIRGADVEGQTLSASSGEWTGVSISYDYQWQRCDTSGEGCSPIAGAADSAYELGASDVGLVIRVVVNASNKNGSVTAVSAASAVVGPAPAPAPSPQPPATTSATTTSTPPTTTTTLVTTTTASTTQSDPAYSSSRFVYCLGDPDWLYGGSSTAGWWYGGTSTGWVRDSAGTDPITPQRVYFDDSVPVMGSVSGSYGKPGSSGPCRTVATRIDPSDPSVPGIALGAQASVLRMDQQNDTDPFWGSRPSSSPQQGETWLYGYAASTNAGYVPYGADSTDLGFGNWNSFGLEFHSSIGSLGPVMQEVATIGPAGGGTAGPNGAISYACNSGMVKLAQPRLELALTAGLNNATVNDASHTCLRFQGPVFRAGAVYKVIYQVKWDAFGQGTFRWWVDSGDGRGYVEYADASGVSTLWRDSAGNVDAHTYPQFLNYRRADSSLPTSIMYYGGFVRGSTLTDVTVP